MNWAPEVAWRRSNARVEPRVDGFEAAFRDMQHQCVGEPIELGTPAGRSTGDGLLRPRAGEIPAPDGVRADRSVEPDVVAVQVGHPELVARPDAIHGDLDRPAGVAAVVERLDQVHVRAADVVRGSGLPPDLERVADRDHPVGARAEQREVTPVGVQGVTLLCPRIDLPGDRDRLLAEGGQFGVAINQHQDLAEARERTRPFSRRLVGRGDRHGLAVGLEGAGHVAEHPQATPELLAQDACSERVGDPVDATVGFLAVRNGAPQGSRPWRRPRRRPAPARGAGRGLWVLGDVTGALETYREAVAITPADRPGDGRVTRPDPDAG